MRRPSRRAARSIAAVAAALLVVALILAFRPGGLLARDPVWDEMQQTGVWRVGLDPSFPPFEFLDDSGEVRGFDLELVQELGRRMGVETQVVSTGFDELIDAVAAGRLQGAASALPQMPWRTEEVHYSDPYFEGGLVLVARPDGAVHEVDDLPGRAVAFEWGSHADALARELGGTENASFRLAPMESADAALDAVATGSADAAIVDSVSLALFAAVRGGVAQVGPALQADPYVVYVPRHAPVLRQELNAALGEMAEDGALAALHGRWLGPTSAGQRQAEGSD